MQKWVEVRKGGNYKEIGAAHNISPVLARLLRNRDISEDEMDIFLHGSLENMDSPHNMKDVDKACEILRDKFLHGKKIRIIGDYDIDGVCSTYILASSFEKCIKHLSSDSKISTALPHRINDGYGLNVRLIDDAINDGIDTIVTCDNGISALNEIKYAREKGMTVIVTDHHELSYHEEDGRIVYELPEANAIVNPKQEDCKYKYKMMCGAGVAFVLCRALYEYIGVTTDARENLDITALATIGDVMPLDGENRIIVKEGLRDMKNTSNIGLMALIEACEIGGKDLSTFDVGFILGPCINATGRLDTADNALRLFLTSDINEAKQLAYALRAYNDERKSMTEMGEKEAFKYVDSLEKLPDVLVIYLADCHESLAGIIAGRVREKYNRPTFVLTSTEDGVKGSGRSIEEYDMHAALIECREIFSKFGGHKMAAGISMAAESDSDREKCVQKLSEMLNEKSTLKDEDFYEKMLIDLELPFSYISEELISELNLIEPCGTGNRKPLFATRGVTMNAGRVMGKNKNVYKAYAKDSSGRNMECVMFGDAEVLQSELRDGRERLLAYFPTINEFRGVRTLQISGKAYK